MTTEHFDTHTDRLVTERFDTLTDRLVTDRFDTLESIDSLLDVSFHITHFVLAGRWRACGGDLAAGQAQGLHACGVQNRA